jgi:hypothetical protein
MTADSSDAPAPIMDGGGGPPVPGDRWLRRRWWIPIIAALAPVLIILAALVWFTGRDDGTSAVATTSATGTTALGADFTEVPTFDLSKVGSAKFASLTKKDGDTVQSYMFASGQPGFIALAEAVAAATPTNDAVGDTGTTLTFVTNDKGTVTLTLDLPADRFAYAGKTWQPAGDLDTIVQEAITQGG